MRADFWGKWIERHQITTKTGWWARHGRAILTQRWKQRVADGEEAALADGLTAEEIASREQYYARFRT